MLSNNLSDLFKIIFSTYVHYIRLKAIPNVCTHSNTEKTLSRRRVETLSFPAVFKVVKQYFKFQRLNLVCIAVVELITFKVELAFVTLRVECIKSQFKIGVSNATLKWDSLFLYFFSPIRKRK